jgi:hypothetical protein
MNNDQAKTGATGSEPMRHERRISTQKEGKNPKYA